MTNIKGYRWSIVIMTVYNAVFFGVKIFSANAGSGGYILSALCTVAALIVYSVLFAVLPKGREMKKIPCKIVFGTLLVLSSVWAAAAASAYTARLVGNVFMKKSPFPYILVLTAFPSFMGAYFGFKSASRYSLVAGRIIFFAAAVILLLTVQEYDRDNLYPIFGSISARDVLIFPSVFSPLIYLPAIAAVCGGNDGVAGEGTKIILISGAAMTAVCLVYNLTVPREALTLFENPLLVIASTINFDFIFERCEALVLVIWLFLSYLNICALTTMAADFLCKSFSLSCRNAVVWVVFAVIFSAALIADKLGSVDKFFAASAVFGGVVSIVLPIGAAIFSGRENREKS